MKLNKKQLEELVRRVAKSYIIEADKAEEEDPFAANAEGGDEGDEKADEKKPEAEAPAGVPIKFDISSVKRYNNNLFKSDSGVVKSISKDGVVVTVKPDDTDVLVNFDDISESAKNFFKKK
jgi:hypothetical protein